jgi:hypothetical protein
MFAISFFLFEVPQWELYRVILNDCDFFLKLGTFFINYFGKLDTLINSLAYVRHFDILCINKLCQIREDAYVYVNYHIKKQNNQQ